MKSLKQKEEDFQEGLRDWILSNYNKKKTNHVAEDFEDFENIEDFFSNKVAFGDENPSDHNKKKRAPKKQIKQKVTQKESLDLIGEVKSACLLCIGRYFLKTIKEHVKQNIKDPIKNHSVRDDLKQKGGGKVKKLPNINTKNLYGKGFANYENVIGYCRHYLKRIEKELKQKERESTHQNQEKTAYIDLSHQQDLANHGGVIGYCRHYFIEIKEKIKLFHLTQNQQVRSKQKNLRALDLKRKGFDYLDDFNKDGEEKKRKRKKHTLYIKPKVPITRFPTFQYYLGWLLFKFLRFLADDTSFSSFSLNEGKNVKTSRLPRLSPTNPKKTRSKKESKKTRSKKESKKTRSKNPLKKRRLKEEPKKTRLKDLKKTRSKNPLKKTKSTNLDPKKTKSKKDLKKTRSKNPLKKTKSTNLDPKKTKSTKKKKDRGLAYMWEPDLSNATSLTSFPMLRPVSYFTLPDFKTLRFKEYTRDQTQRFLQKLVEQEKQRRQTQEIYIKPRLSIVRDHLNDLLPDSLLKQILHPKQSDHLKRFAQIKKHHQSRQGKGTLWQKKEKRTMKKRERKHRKQQANFHFNVLLSYTVQKQILYNHYKKKLSFSHEMRNQNRKKKKTKRRNKQLPCNIIFGLGLDDHLKVSRLINRNKEWPSLVLGIPDHFSNKLTEGFNQSLLYNTQSVPDLALLMEEESLKDQERYLKSLTDNNTQFASFIAYIYKQLSLIPYLLKKQEKVHNPILPDHFRVDSRSHKLYLKKNTIYLKYLIDCFFQTEKLVLPLLTSSYSFDPPPTTNPVNLLLPGSFCSFSPKKIKKTLETVKTLKTLKTSKTPKVLKTLKSTGEKKKKMKKAEKGGNHDQSKKKKQEKIKKGKKEEKKKKGEKSKKKDKK